MVLDKSITHQYQALTRLTRLCQTAPENATHLQNVLNSNLATLAPLALQIAQETGDPIGQLLADSLTTCNNHDLLLDLYEQLPINTIALREVHTLITQRMAETAIQHPDNWTLQAETSGAYATALTDNGDHQQALTYAQHSACLYQRYVDHPTDPSLQSLFRLAECYMQTGQMEHCLLAHAEALSGYHTLCTAEPARYITQYTNGLLVMSSYHKMLEQLDQAIHFCSQAEQQIQRIANPTLEHTCIHHRIINNLASCYEQIDQLDIAAYWLQDNIRLIRDLADHAPDQYLLELIDTLENLAGIEARRGNKTTAQSLAEEALWRFAPLYQQRPSAFASRYTTLLINLSLIDLVFAEPCNADTKLQQAISILEPLYAASPQRFAPNLAALLNNRVEVDLALHQYATAIRHAHRSLCLYRSLGKQHSPNLAMALNTLSNAHMQAGNAFRAHRACQTAVRRYRQLAHHDQKYATDLAMTLGTLAAIQDQLEDPISALITAEEALNLWHGFPDYLRQAYPQAYYQAARIRLTCLVDTEHYTDSIDWAENLLQQTNGTLTDQQKAGILNLYSVSLQALGDTDQALYIARQEVACLRKLPTTEIPAYQVDLADALVNLCKVLMYEQMPNALLAIEEAVELYETLPEPLTLHMQINKATALYNLGSVAYASDQQERATQSLQAALHQQRSIVESLQKSGFYPTDLLLTLQLLVNIYYQHDNPAFIDTARELNERLSRVPVEPDVVELQQQLQHMQTRFTASMVGLEQPPA